MTKSALLLGATGAVGKKLLVELLASDEWSRVGEYGRRVTTPPPMASGKLDQRTIDFENLGSAGLKEGKWDVVFVTLGTTKAQAGSAERFEKIDREYVVNACRAAKSDDPSHEQRIVYVSSAGADAKSSFLYTKSKGLTELELAGLGYADAIVFRPAMLKNTERPTIRIAESVLGVVTGVLSHVSPTLEIDVSLLAKSMSKAGAMGSAKIPAEVGASEAGQEGAWFTLLTNKAASILGRS